MITIGIDPGTAETGYGMIEFDSGGVKIISHGSIKTSIENEQSFRLNEIFTRVCELIEKNKPETLAIESLFFFSNAKSVIAVGQAIGVIKLAAARNNVKVFDYPPLRIKMSLTGNGRAEKKDIQEKVKAILKLKEIPRPNHAADALAVAICHHIRAGDIINLLPEKPKKVKRQAKKKK